MNVVFPSNGGASWENAYHGRRVFVTGHTGFKGAWLCEWLLELGAEVAGFSLEPPTTPSLFDQLGLAKRLGHHCIGDVRNETLLSKELLEFAPEFVFHLAAQPLVRASYSIPVETFAVNILGTAHLLEATRQLSNPCSVVVVTTDKCYKNSEAGRAFQETDPLGGHDPYSSSKAGAELVVECYRASFFSKSSSLLSLASARAGNVIGGGDWALDRIVPDAMRALAKHEPIPVRNPHAVRPFQHVLEPLGAYLLLGAHLAKGEPLARAAFNFGPEQESHRSVESLVTEILKHWPGAWLNTSDSEAPHEAKLLHLSIEKAHQILGWHPIWSFEEAIEHTVSWYRHAAGPEADIPAFTQAQIAAYRQAIHHKAAHLAAV